jgi:hypothetical protein
LDSKWFNLIKRKHTWICSGRLNEKLTMLPFLSKLFFFPPPKQGHGTVTSALYLVSSAPLLLGTPKGSVHSRHFPSLLPIQVRRVAGAEWKAGQLFWNSCRCLKSKGFFSEPHLHLPYAISAKACGVFVFWFDRLTCNGQDGWAAAPNSHSDSWSPLETNPWITHGVSVSFQRKTCCSNVLLALPLLSWFFFFFFFLVTLF